MCSGVRGLGFGYGENRLFPYRFLMGFLPDADPGCQTQPGHVLADDIFICISVVELLEPPFFGVVADGSPEYGKDFFAVVPVVVGFEFFGQSGPVFLHGAEPDPLRIEVALLGNVGQDEALGGLGSSFRKPDVVFIDAFGRGVGIDGDAVDLR